MSLGCGVPTEVDIHAGETVLDLGSGGGADVLISARRVAPGGKAIGLDMTDETLDLARRHAADAGVTNVEFIKGYIEDIPLPYAAVDVVISNCVINLAADKRAVLRELARVLRVKGPIAVSDAIDDRDMDHETPPTWSNGPAASPAPPPAPSSSTPSPLRGLSTSTSTRRTASTPTPVPRSSELACRKHRT